MPSTESDSRFYDTTYGRFAEELYATIHGDAYGEDIGQSSWLTADDQRVFCSRLELGPSTPLGLDEQLIREAGFADVRLDDASENPARVASAWHAAR